jgi:hypothetical protein
MPKKGHSEEQIIAALKPYESGDKVAEICRKLGVSEATLMPHRGASVGLPDVGSAIWIGEPFSVERDKRSRWGACLAEAPRGFKWDRGSAPPGCIQSMARS